MTNKPECDNIIITVAKQGGFVASVGRILCEIRKDFNEREK